MYLSFHKLEGYEEKVFRQENILRLILFFTNVGYWGFAAAHEYIMNNFDSDSKVNINCPLFA